MNAIIKRIIFCIPTALLAYIIISEVFGLPVFKSIMLAIWYYAEIVLNHISIDKLKEEVESIRNIKITIIQNNKQN